MDTWFWILMCVICSGVGFLLGQHKEADKNFKNNKNKELEQEQKINDEIELRHRRDEDKKKDIKNIKFALKNLSLRNTFHHCEGVYAMLKSKYISISEGKELEKQIYDLLIKETKK